MISRVFVLLLAVVPVAELYLLFRIADRIGGLSTVALVIGSALLGSALARMEGVRVVREFQRSLAEGRPPGGDVINGVLVLLGGLLLIVPGVLTDVAGLLLLVPFTRRLFARLLLARVRTAVERGSVRVTTLVVAPEGPVSPRTRGPIIDVEGESVAPEPKANRAFPPSRA